MITELIQQLKRDEGVKPCVYKDSLGLFTIGIGRLVDDRRPGAGLRTDEMEYMLRNDIEDRINALTKRLPWFVNLDDARKGALLAMAFQMGVDGLLGFKNTLAMVRAGDYEGASKGMLESTWAKQTPERAKRISEQMKTGVWQ